MKNEKCKGMLCYKDNNIKQLKTKESMFFKLNKFRLIYPSRPLLLSEFGKITWNSFHRICAYFSAQPSEQERNLMKNMFQGFAYFFPCDFCRDDFVQQMKEFPIKLKNNIELSHWFMNQHNRINEKLKKEVKNYNGDELISFYLI